MNTTLHALKMPTSNVSTGSCPNLILSGKQRLPVKCVCVGVEAVRATVSNCTDAKAEPLLGYQCPSDSVLVSP